MIVRNDHFARSIDFCNASAGSLIVTGFVCVEGMLISSITYLFPLTLKCHTMFLFVSVTSLILLQAACLTSQVIEISALMRS